MKLISVFPCLVLLAAPLAAQPEPAVAPDEAARADLARLIHKLVVAKMPPLFEDRSGWGQTVPLPERLRLPRARRTVVQVGDHLEAPDGTWRKVRVWMADPNRDLQVRVRSFKKLGATSYRVVIETDAALHTEADVQRWRNGLELADVTARADVALNVVLECDFTGRLDAGRVPPRLLLEPDVRELKLNLQEFTPKQVTFRRAGVTIAGEGVEAVREEARGMIQGMLRSVEPDLKRRAGEALARALKERQESLPAAELLRAIGPLLRAEQRSDEK